MSLKNTTSITESRSFPVTNVYLTPRMTSMYVIGCLVALLLLLSISCASVQVIPVEDIPEFDMCFPDRGDEVSMELRARGFARDSATTGCI